VPPPSVAFQGELGAYSEEALHRFFGAGAVPVPCREFHDVARAVAAGRAERGLLPIENTIFGSVKQSFEILAAGDFSVFGEVIVPIHHCVLGMPGARLESVHQVLSHPVALGQCTRFLRAHPELEPVPVYDTAGAAKTVAEQGDPTVAALAGRTAAERYGLAILAADVEDRSDNQTRFLAITRADIDPGPVPDAGSAAKSLLRVRVDNRAGALLRLLQPFADAGLNLAKLETHPDVEPWALLFFLEIEASTADERMGRALEAAARNAVEVKVLGSYRRWVDTG
jgi:prephenate dehydratase